MKSIPGIRPHRILASATRAARRFRVRRVLSQRNTTWRPVPLVWRRKVQVPTTLRQERMQRAAGHMWRPQIHLHFLTRVEMNPAPGSRHSSSPAPLLAPRSVLSERQKTIIRFITEKVPASRNRLSLRSLALRRETGAASPRVQHAPEYLAVARRSTNPLTVSWADSPGRRVSGAEFPTHGQSRAYSKSSNTARSVSRSLWHINAPPVLWTNRLARSPKLRQFSPDVRPEKKAELPIRVFRASRVPNFAQSVALTRRTTATNVVPLLMDKRAAGRDWVSPQELVWRRGPPPTVERDESEQLSQLRQSAAQTPGRSLSGAAAVSGMTTPFGVTQPTSTLKLDSNLIDRLADDVIRRVERRARINRERRGI